MRKLSPSSINLYRECPKKFQYRYDDSIVPLPSKYEDEMRVGRKVHKTIEIYYENNDGAEEKTKNDILLNLARAMDELDPEETFDNEDRMYNNLKGFVNFEMWRRSNNLKLVSSEEFLKKEEICGRIDAILKSRNKKICVDFKTGYSSSLNERKYIQAMMYKLLADWDEFYFVYTIWNDKKKVKPKKEEWIENIINEAMRGVKNNEFDRNEGEHCKQCEYSVYCKAQKNGVNIWSDFDD